MKKKNAEIQVTGVISSLGCGWKVPDLEPRAYRVCRTAQHTWRGWGLVPEQGIDVFDM